MRLIATACLPLLVLAALLFGNCYSCPQLLLGLHAAPHNCCNHPGTSRQDCQSQVLQHFVKADPARPMQPQPIAELPAVAAGGPILQVASGPVSWLPFPHAPPDLEILNSTFRI
jgi:hypothetical protein